MWLFFDAGRNEGDWQESGRIKPEISQRPSVESEVLVIGSETVEETMANIWDLPNLLNHTIPNPLEEGTKHDFKYVIANRRTWKVYEDLKISKNDCSVLNKGFTALFEKYKFYNQPKPPIILKQRDGESLSDMLARAGKGETSDEFPSDDFPIGFNRTRIGISSFVLLSALLCDKEDFRNLVNQLVLWSEQNQLAFDQFFTKHPEFVSNLETAKRMSPIDQLLLVNCWLINTNKDLNWRMSKSLDESISDAAYIENIQAVTCWNAKYGSFGSQYGGRHFINDDDIIMYLPVLAWRKEYMPNSATNFQVNVAKTARRDRLIERLFQDTGTVD